MRTPKTPVLNANDDATVLTSQHTETDELAQYYDLLLSEQSSTCWGKLERIPLACKLFLLSTIAFFGMLVFAIWLLVVNISVFQRANTANSISQLATLASDFLDKVEHERVTGFYLLLFNKGGSLTVAREQTNAMYPQVMNNALLLPSNLDVAGKKKLDIAQNLYGKITSYARLRIDAFDTLNAFNISETYNHYAESFIEVVSHVCAQGDATKAMQLSLLMRTKEQLFHQYESGRVLIESRIVSYPPSIVRFMKEDFVHGKETRVEMEAVLGSLINSEQEARLNTLYMETPAFLKLQNEYEPQLLNYIYQTSPNMTVTDGTSYDTTMDTLNKQLKITIDDWAKSFNADAATSVGLSIGLVIVIVALLIGITACVCITSTITSNTIIGPWRRLNLNQELMISKFVPRDFLKLLKVQRISDVKLGQSAQTSLAVLHCQIANFDALTQSMNPQEKFFFVMKYLSNLGPLIRLNGGYIDKYYPNCFVAVFKKSADAVKAATDIYQYIKKEQLNESSKYSVIIRPVIGIHYSKSNIVGTIGEGERMESSMISEALEVAGNLAPMNSRLKSSILVTKNVAEKLDTSIFKYRYMGKTTIGARNPIDIYEVFPANDPKAETMDNFTKAMVHMQELEFKQARDMFAGVLDKNSNDASSETHFELCKLHLDTQEDAISSQHIQSLHLNDVLNDVLLSRAFEQFLCSEYSSENYKAWKLVHEYQVKITQRKEIATKIYDLHVHPKAKYALNIDNKTALNVMSALQNDMYSDGLFDALKMAVELLLFDSYKRFKVSPMMRKALAQKKVVMTPNLVAS